MEKETLLNIIIQDIKELDTLINTFIGKPEIPKAFIKLAQNKAKGVLEEIDLLEFFVDEDSNIDFKKETPIQKKIQPIKEELKPKQKDEFAIEPKFTIEPKSTLEVEKVAEIFPEKEITLGEKYMQDNQSVNDTLAIKNDTEKLPRFMNRPIKNLSKAIGINDRFLFIRELFDNSDDLYNTVLEQLETMPDMKSAEQFLATNFQWDDNNEAVKVFKDFVRRKYIL
ncbi:MAG: hypothetical protein FWH18_12075 [Marinilabiliaceae bacterium]|nr:hypothetical protein [Marinilabiliaceae bacterium]